MERVNRRTSLFAALAGWALCSALAVFIIWGQRDRARLIRDNDNERILNTLFAGLREYEDAAQAVEENETLRQAIKGFGLYGADGEMLQSWGNVPPRFDRFLLAGAAPLRFARYTIPDRKNRSVRFVIHNERNENERNERTKKNGGNERPLRQNDGLYEDDRYPPPKGHMERGQGRRIQGPWAVPFSGGYIYIDVLHPAYWRTITVTGILYPLSVLALLLLMLAVRRLYVRNLEYRERIEAQHNLVVLGTAAGTLAHEIKNPLHSIKLQTGILKKTLARAETGTETGADEIRRIDEEVDRLAALTYRVNDYLRDARGNPERLDLAALLEEISFRLCGRSIVEVEGGSLPPGSSPRAGPPGGLPPPPSAGLRPAAPRLQTEMPEGGRLQTETRPCFVFMDPGRARSVFENIIANALESGGPPEDCGASVKIDGSSAAVRVWDRGRGIAEPDLPRVFDPFFTTKSGGTGIGLAVSKRFVEAAGGSVSVENRNGGGVMVTVTLPCAREER
jgi:two-component system sensor histidine kinase HydH